MLGGYIPFSSVCELQSDKISIQSVLWQPSASSSAGLASLLDSLVPTTHAGMAHPEAAASRRPSVQHTHLRPCVRQRPPPARLHWTPGSRWAVRGSTPAPQRQLIYSTTAPAHLVAAHQPAGQTQARTHTQHNDIKAGQPTDCLFASFANAIINRAAVCSRPVSWCTVSCGVC